MGWALVRAALRRAVGQVRHVTPVRPRSAGDLVARVYQQVERDFGMLAPPIALHSPAPGPLAASWMMLRESLLADGVVGRATKEAVATAVSRDNACPYCVAVHGATLSGLAGAHTAAAVAEDRAESLTDPGVRAIVGWAHAGRIRQPAAGQRVPFPVEQAPELVGVVATFQYLNRMVNVFLGESPLPPAVPGAARGRMTWLLGLYLRAGARSAHEPGVALDLLPPAPLPEDLTWASGNPTVAEAFARAAFAIDDAGRRSVPVPVRDLVSARLADWDGQPVGPSRAWVHEAVAELPGGQRPAGRLALLAALASYQIDQSVVNEFRRAQPDDRTLVELASWASMAAARRVAGWMPIGRQPTTRSLMPDDTPTV